MSYELKLPKLRADVHDCAVLFLSRANTNLCCNYITLYVVEVVPIPLHPNSHYSVQFHVYRLLIALSIIDNLSTCIKPIAATKTTAKWCSL